MTIYEVTGCGYASEVLFSREITSENENCAVDQVKCILDEEARYSLGYTFGDCMNIVVEEVCTK